MTDPVRLMVTGDLHLGRHPTKIPADRDGKRFSPGTIWGSIVDRSITTGVDAVVVTGDVLDRENSFYEAWGPFEAGLSRLEADDIPLFAVAGNHDYGVLESFFQSMSPSNGHLLGEGGRWQREALSRAGEPVLYFDGWSYPRRHPQLNPLDSFDLEHPDRPALGILHTDLNRSKSKYAPVMDRDLRQTFHEGWLLGHIHSPGRRSDSPLILYPGSPQPLDPAETEVHGPWVVTVDSDGSIETRMIPLATLEYLSLTVDVSGLDRAENLIGTIKQAAQTRLNHAEPTNPELQLYLLRVKLEGEAEFETAGQDTFEKITTASPFQVRGIPVSIEKIIDRTRPSLDLDQLSGGRGPVSRLAQLVQTLDSDPSDLSEELIRGVEEQLDQVYHANTYEPLRVHGDVEKPGVSERTQLIREQAFRLIHELRSQKEPSDE